MLIRETSASLICICHCGDDTAANDTRTSSDVPVDVDGERSGLSQGRAKNLPLLRSSDCGGIIEIIVGSDNSHPHGPPRKHVSVVAVHPGGAEIHGTQRPPLDAFQIVDDALNSDEMVIDIMN